ncbi:hypothetical protein [Frankia sp. CcWB2]
MMLSITYLLLHYVPLDRALLPTIWPPRGQADPAFGLLRLVGHLRGGLFRNLQYR